MGKTEKARQEVESFLEPRYLNLDSVIDDIEREVVLYEGLFVGVDLELRRCGESGRKLALAISGGGAGGAYSAGALEVLLSRLRERGIKVDLLVGTSSGALNGYGVFVESLGKANPQLDSNPAMKQPFKSYIASIWSYLDRDGKASRWVVGRRSWLIGLASKGVSPTARKLGFIAMLLLLTLLINPYLFVSMYLASGLGGSEFKHAGQPHFFAENALHFSVMGLVSLLVLGFLVNLLMRVFGKSLFLDIPLLQLLANTGPTGDLTEPRLWPRAQTIDRARVLSRELVAEWYTRADELPEFIITATDISVGRECLFTLVRPETYARLTKREWMTVQFDSEANGTKEYRKNEGSLFALPENLLRCVIASSAVPGAFPTQRIGIYGSSGRKHVRHNFVDGGVLNNSPIHIAIDAGATHVISLELRPVKQTDPMDSDERGRDPFGLFQAALTTFTTVLDRATDEDIRRTVAWNRFLTRHPESLRAARPSRGETEDTKAEGAAVVLGRRIVPLYRIAPRDRKIGTVEFDGHFVNGKRTVALRDLIRRGVVDMQGENIWRATTQHEPKPE